ncbi:mannitol dehydrogenase family protein [Rheinheimera sp.]|uniref:mannitol dehydrogenase family protein n=1 Tax=Rheinheimera sp. TaxID=1869214 RepID=UPI00307EF48C
MSRLSRTTAQDLLPAYLQNKTPGIGLVHLGPGAFFRGHQAWYSHRALLLAGGDWRICAVSMRSSDVAAALQPQDGLYYLAAMEQQTELELVGSIAEVLVAPNQYGQVLARLTAKQCRYVTLTITEKGYCLNGRGELDLTLPVVAADLALAEVQPDGAVRAESAIGLLVQALFLRYQANLPLLTLMSCDNLTDNGHKLKAAVQAFAANALAYREQAGFIAALQQLICPCSMVDSITPATDDALRELVQQQTGFTDAWPVKREAFVQWVVEDVLPAEQPAWREAGVIFTPDVTAFEKAKLRLLNAPHSTLAYLGSLLGLETVLDAMAHPQLAALVKQLVQQEILPSVPELKGLDLAQYSAAIFQRFLNPSVRHLLAQIAWDGSQKLPMRLIPVILDNVQAGRPVRLLAVAIASWLQFIRRRAMQQHLAEPVPLVDPLASQLLAIAGQCSGKAATDLPLWLALDAVFPASLSRHPLFVPALCRAYDLLSHQSATDALQPQWNLLLNGDPV